MTLSSTTVQSVALCTYAATILQWAPANAANILAVETSPCKSHWNIMRSVLRVLTDHGHTMTVFTPFADGDRDGYTEVNVETAVRLGLTAGFMTDNFSTTRKLIINQMNDTRAGCDTIYGHRRMVEILDGTATGEFDLVITEPLNSECVAYVATVLRVPMIYVIRSPIIKFLERSLTGHAPNPAAVGHILSRRGVIQTFIDRFINVVLTVYSSTLKWYVEQHHRFADSRPYDDVDLVRPSVIFTNTHFITEPARPLIPDVVQIGGVHLTTPEPIPTVISRTEYNVTPLFVAAIRFKISKHTEFTPES